jgi:hypothetical protein
MQFAFMNADETVAALMAGSPSFASQYTKPADAASAIKTKAIELFKKGYKAGVSADQVANGVLHTAIWRGVGVTFESVTKTNAPLEESSVGFTISTNPIIAVSFWCLLPLD